MQARMLRGPPCQAVLNMSYRFCRILRALAFIVPLCSHSAQSAALVVSQHDPNASDIGPGTESRPFKTIAPAAERAQPGDTVLVHAGIYRERVTPARGGEEARPITY
jgi:hypothetical protein